MYVKGTPQAIEPEDEAKEAEKQWSVVFEDQRRKIIELWHECNIPLLHRTYFFLLVKGDPSDSVYIEVELRRLSFLKQTLDQVARSYFVSLSYHSMLICFDKPEQCICPYMIYQK